MKCRRYAMSTQLGNKDIMARNIQYYMDLTGKSRNDMCEALNIKYTTFTDWVKGNTYPRIDSIEKMANYFGIEKSDLIEEHSTDSDLTGITNISFPASKPVPILGDICAGEGTWCEENFEGHFFIDSSVKADFCVRVRGDSMIEAGIFNGDLAFIKKTYDYTNGKIYAVRINSDCEAVLKKVFWQEDTIILNPCNADYEPIVTDAEGMTVIGECVGVFHSTISMF
jgi:putative prophage lambdaCh01, repressor protein